MHKKGGRGSARRSERTREGERRQGCEKSALSSNEVCTYAHNTRARAHTQTHKHTAHTHAHVRDRGPRKHTGEGAWRCWGEDAAVRCVVPHPSQSALSAPRSQRAHARCVRTLEPRTHTSFLNVAATSFLSRRRSRPRDTARTPTPTCRGAVCQRVAAGTCALISHAHVHADRPALNLETDTFYSLRVRDTDTGGLGFRV